MFIDFGADVMTGAAKRSRTPPEFIAKVHDGTQEVEQRQVCPSCARMRRNICGRGIWASGCGERGPLCYCRRKIFWGEPLLPTSAPLPFYAYPFLVMTLISWIWSLLRERSA